MQMGSGLSKEMGSIDMPTYRPQGRSLGVVFDSVTVLGRGGAPKTVNDLPAILTAIISSPLRPVQLLSPARRSQEKKIICDVSGVVFPGEMLLVLGRPGSGCSTTLKVLANQRDSFVDVKGSCKYATLSSEQISGAYRSEVVYNAEDDIHFPKLSVSNTLGFSIGSRRPPEKSTLPDKEFTSLMMDRILGSLGIMHTKDTIVGDAFVRGVSGGERKRVSLAEVLSTNPAIACWDNPIRGLDSSSALQYLRVLQEMSRSTGMSNIVTLYQASETMYQECFDRVLVLYGGRMIYCGPARDAKQYFYDLGFECPDRQTTPDFLTAVTSPSERRFRPDYLGPRYTDQISLAKAFRESPNYQKLLTDMDSYRDLTRAPTYLDSFCEEVDRVRSRLTPRNAIEPASIPRQIAICLIRYYQLLWGDWNTLLVTVLMCAINAVITGSAYFMAPKTSIGSFEKGGALFISLIYFCLNSMTEVPKTVNARSILLKQHRLGLTHPAVYVITQAIGDIPVALLQTLVFSCCYYFMIGAVKTASNFWIFLLIIFTHYAAVASMFRMLGAWAPNLSVALLTAGSALPVICLYSGYAPTIPTMHRWGSWIRRIAPSPWALEALMGNEFEYITLHCTPSELVPSGTGYSDIQYQGCPLPGSQKGSTFVAGKEYLAEHYRFYHQNLWRNFGIILAMWAIYVILTAIGLSVMTRDSGTSGAPVYKRGAKILSENKKFTRAITEGDLEKQTQQEPQTGVPQAHLESGRISSSTSTIDRSECSSTDVGVSLRGKAPPKVFTFSNVNYFVPESGQEKQLLRDVSGFVKAGQLTALMGASGAGKTTLLDTISGRKSDGRVEGEMLLNGHPLNRAFARSCGFCQQQDVHEPKSTIREALQFSARLRQPATVSEEDKMAYVEHIISLLEMGQIADALIGEPGDGLLNVEERKRVTIGVELAAKPSTLLVLDEPTSGLDSQAAYSIIAFLQKIAAQGIPIVCTIHQPSGVIFDMFDHILLLAPGGQTVFFGETGLASRNLVDYFTQHGATMSKSENPAEFILAAVKADDRDWAETWRNSKEAADLKQELLSLKEKLTTMDTEVEHSVSEDQEYALPLALQIKELTKRHWTAVWRNGAYNFSRLFATLFFEMFVAFTFFKVGPDVQGLQNHMLALLLGTWAIPTVASDTQALWFSKWAIFEARERNGIYSYKALVVAMLVVEMVWQLFAYTLIFLCFYWTVGYSSAPPAAGYTYLMLITLGFFGVGWSYLMAALFPNATMAGFANALFWMILVMFNGGPIPHSAMNGFYKPWLFWADPLRYYLGGTVATVLNAVQAQCNEGDLAVFDPVPGLTCIEYASVYMESSPGYLVNPTATTSCEYCQYSTGKDYSSTLDYHYSERWWYWAVFLAFALCNILLLFLVTALMRVKLRLWKKKFHDRYSKAH